MTRIITLILIQLLAYRLAAQTVSLPLAEYNKTRDSLTTLIREVQSLKDKNKAQEESLHNNSTKHQSTEKDLRDSLSRVKTKLSDKERENGRLRQNQENYEGLQRRYDNIQIVLRNATTELENAKENNRNYERVKREAEACKSHLAYFRERYQKLQSDSVQLIKTRQELNNCQVEQARSKAKEAELSQKINQNEGQVQNLNERINQCESNLNQVKQNKDRCMQSTFDNLKEEVKRFACNARVEDCSGPTINNVRQQINNLANCVEPTRVQELNDLLRQLEQNCETLQRCREVLNHKYNESDVRQAKSELGAIKPCSPEMQNEVRQLTDLLNGYKSKSKYACESFQLIQVIGRDNRQPEINRVRNEVRGYPYLYQEYQNLRPDLRDIPDVCN